MKLLVHFVVAKVILLVLASSFVNCYDPSPLQDYCVAVDNTKGAYVNGRFCKDPRQVTSHDFFASGLNKPGNTSSRLGAAVKVLTMPGLNTLGVTMARIDIKPGGQIPPHIHPRASEIILCLKGKLLVGFVSSNQYNNTFFSKVLYPGDVFVFPKGLIQFHANIGKKNAVAIGALGSQNAGYIGVGNTVFGSKPLIDPKILAEAFALEVDKINYLQKVFSSGNDIVITRVTE